MKDGRTGQLSVVSVLLAVYNEEKVIRAKLESIFSSDYQQISWSS